MVGFHCHVSFRGCSIWLVTMVIVSPPKDQVVGPLPNGCFMAYKWSDSKMIVQEGGSNQTLLLHPKIHASKSKWHENIKLYLIWYDMIWSDLIWYIYICVKNKYDMAWYDIPMIFHIWLTVMVNVGKYTMRWSYRNLKEELTHLI